MRDTDYKPLRREFLGVGLTGAMVGLAGCTDSVSIETGSGDESSEESTNQSPDLASVELSFSYNTAEQQATVEFVGGADIKAGNIQIRQGSETKVAWSDLGSTLAASDQNISPGATAVLGENVLNWGQPVAKDHLIRVVYTGRDSPATLERYSPPESTDSESTVPASISGFSLESSGEQQLQVSFDSSKQLGTIEVAITGAESATLTRTDFTETASGDGMFTYSANYEAGSDGDYTAILSKAEDTEGANALNGETISDTTSTETQEQPSDTTPPSISAFSIANPSAGKIRVSFDSTEELETIQVSVSGPESVELTTSDFVQPATSGSGVNYQSTYEPKSVGTYTAELSQAVDAAGNDGSANVEVSVEIDGLESTGPTQGLENHYNGDPIAISGNTVIDLSPAENDATIVGDVQTGIDAPVGSAFGFEQNEDNYIELPTQREETFTLSAWVKRESGGEWHVFITQGSTFSDTRNYWFGGHTDGNRIHFSVQNKNGENKSINSPEGSLPQNEWTHVAAVYDGSDQIIYIDGDEVSRQTFNITPVTSDNPGYIGRYREGNGEFKRMNGNIADPRVYNRPLTPDEINQLATM